MHHNDLYYSVIILLKPHVWKKSGSLVKLKMLSANQIAGVLNVNISKTIGGMAKEAIKTLRSQKLEKVYS